MRVYLFLGLFRETDGAPSDNSHPLSKKRNTQTGIQAHPRRIRRGLLQPVLHRRLGKEGFGRGGIARERGKRGTKQHRVRERVVLPLLGRFTVFSPQLFELHASRFDPTGDRLAQV